MRLRPQQSGYLARKIAIDLANAPFVKFLKGIDAVAEATKKIIDENLEREEALDKKVKEIIEQNYDEIEFQLANERQLFFMIKKKLAPEYNIIMNYDDRFSDLSHQILDELWQEYIIDFQVSDNQVKNIIFKAFKEFAKIYDEIDDIVYSKIRNMEKEYIPGSPDYDLIYQRLYEEELRRRGVI
jgi:hypothetical protein